jgi:hypothetical protein
VNPEPPPRSPIGFLNAVSRELLRRAWNAGAVPATERSRSTSTRPSARRTGSRSRAPSTTATPTAAATIRCSRSRRARATCSWPGCVKAVPTVAAAPATSCARRSAGCATRGRGRSPGAPDRAPGEADTGQPAGACSASTTTTPSSPTESGRPWSSRPTIAATRRSRTPSEASRRASGSTTCRQAGSPPTVPGWPSRRGPTTWRAGRAASPSARAS